MAGRRAAIATMWLAIWLVTGAAAAQTPPSTSPATTRIAPAPPELASRVSAFFTAWQARDLAAMYEFYCPAYKQSTPRPEYLKLSRLLRFPILRFALRGIEVDGGRTSVVIDLENDTAPMPTGVVKTETRQVWLNDGAGVWCRESETLLLPFPGGW